MKMCLYFYYVLFAYFTFCDVRSARAKSLTLMVFEEPRQLEKSSFVSFAEMDAENICKMLFTLKVGRKDYPYFHCVAFIFQTFSSIDTILDRFDFKIIGIFADSTEAQHSQKFNAMKG